MSQPYVLHYAPDNASLIVRLALDHLGLPYRTVLVNRGTQEQSGAAFRALNPMGLIPVLETPQGVMFETGAILLWLADTHGGLGPAHEDPDRGDFLKWLFFASNTLHAGLRMLFYPEKYIDAGQTHALQHGLQPHLQNSFDQLETFAAAGPAWLGGPTPGVLDFYTVALLRWSAIYPADGDQSWFDLQRYPTLAGICGTVESLPCCARLQKAEGLGTRPFTAPRHPTPPEGSAT